MSLALKVQQLNWLPGGHSVLADVGFELPSGKMLGLIGPNGAGKSSLLRCLYRYIRPDSGQIQLFGQDINSLSAKAFAKEVAVVLQDTPAQLALDLTQLVAMGLTPHKGLFDMPSATDNAQVQAALAQVGLQHKAAEPFAQLSGGEKQRALIARAIVQRPKLLILDEPTNHLDIRYQIQILELVRSLGVTVIASIHDLNLASALCDELLLLDNGRRIAHGSPQSVLTEDRIAGVFGVCCQVGTHPQLGRPLIHYFYGYQSSEPGHGKAVSPAALASGKVHGAAIVEPMAGPASAETCVAHKETDRRPGSVGGGA